MHPTPKTYCHFILGGFYLFLFCVCLPTAHMQCHGGMRGQQLPWNWSYRGLLAAMSSEEQPLNSFTLRRLMPAHTGPDLVDSRCSLSSKFYGIQEGSLHTTHFLRKKLEIWTQILTVSDSFTVSKFKTRNRPNKHIYSIGLKISKLT